TWYGVTTDENGRVIRLYLKENGLWGTIPSELGNLTSLRGLSLSDNQLDGTIPSELGNLINLEWLYLDSNQLCGTVPPALGKLSNLTELILFSNQLQGTVPPEMGNLTNLEILYLDSNQLSGAIPTELNNLTNLSEWGISGNQLSGCVPAAWRSEWGWGSDLEKLGLSYCDAPSSPHLVTDDRDVLIAFYRSANGDNWINNSNWLSDAPLNTWYGITTDDSGHVTELELGLNGLSGAIPSELGTLGHLERLSLHGNALRG
ncbi:MAG: hypothetical protein F4047_12040, partial [Caldilineaceae bacterium SB0670_bin_27]|nr:hypothetical protein [Caldilineaceae bacterium SB0670_bin_27]